MRVAVVIVSPTGRAHKFRRAVWQRNNNYGRSPEPRADWHARHTLPVLSRAPVPVVPGVGGDGAKRIVRVAKVAAIIRRGAGMGGGGARSAHTAVKRYRWRGNDPSAAQIEYALNSNRKTTLAAVCQGRIHIGRTVGQAIFSRDHLLGLKLDYKCVSYNKKKKKHTQYDRVVRAFKFNHNHC